MRRAVGVSALTLAVGMAMASEAEVLSLPSGLTATPYEVRTGNGGIYRYRFLAPEFTAEGQSLGLLMIDLEYLCNAYALAHLANAEPVPKQVIISLADRESEFGAIDPDVTQVFEAYRVEDGACKWEMF
jgi:hypothetical protein